MSTELLEPIPVLPVARPLSLPRCSLALKSLLEPGTLTACPFLPPPSFPTLLLSGPNKKGLTLCHFEQWSSGEETPHAAGELGWS